MSFKFLAESSGRKKPKKHNVKSTQYATPVTYQMFLLLKRMLLMASRDRVSSNVANDVYLSQGLS